MDFCLSGIRSKISFENRKGKKKQGVSKETDETIRGSEHRFGATWASGLTTTRGDGEFGGKPVALERRNFFKERKREGGEVSSPYSVILATMEHHKMDDLKKKVRLFVFSFPFHSAYTLSLSLL